MSSMLQPVIGLLLLEYKSRLILIVPYIEIVIIVTDAQNVAAKKCQGHCPTNRTIMELSTLYVQRMPTGNVGQMPTGNVEQMPR